MKEYFKYYINRYFKRNPLSEHLSVKKRLLLLIPSIFWYLLQFLIFTCICGTISILIGLVILFISLFSEKNSDVELGLLFLTMPIVCAISWPYKYIVYGEYNILI